MTQPTRFRVRFVDGAAQHREAAALAALTSHFRESQTEADVVVTDAADAGWFGATVAAVGRARARAVYLLSPAASDAADLLRLEDAAREHSFVVIAYPGPLASRIWRGARDLIRDLRPEILEVDSSWNARVTGSNRVCLLEQLALAADLCGDVSVEWLPGGGALAAIVRGDCDAPVVTSAVAGPSSAHRIDAVSPEARIRVTFGTPNEAAPAQLCVATSDGESRTAEYESTSLSAWRALHAALTSSVALPYTLAKLRCDLDRAATQARR